MTVSFENAVITNLYQTPTDRLGKQKFPKSVVDKFQKTIKMIKMMANFSDMSKFKGLRPEKLKEDKYKDCYSVKVNDQYRVILKKGAQRGSIVILELSKHYE